MFGAQKCCLPYKSYSYPKVTTVNFKGAVCPLECPSLLANSSKMKISNGRDYGAFETQVASPLDWQGVSWRRNPILQPPLAHNRCHLVDHLLGKSALAPLSSLWQICNDHCNHSTKEEMEATIYRRHLRESGHSCIFTPSYTCVTIWEAQSSTLNRAYSFHKQPHWL